jgi:hypothetical protein
MRFFTKIAVFKDALAMAMISDVARSIIDDGLLVGDAGIS